MHKETKAVKHDIGQLAEDAHALMSATADVVGEKMGLLQRRERNAMSYPSPF